MTLLAAAGCSLDESPGTNWVQENGGLPEFICETARAIKKTGKTTSEAIAIAVSRMKVWAATGTSETKAKAAAALSEWEELRAKTKAKDVVKATAPEEDGREPYLFLTSASFNTDAVRQAFNLKQRSSFSSSRGMSEPPTPYSYIRELWTDYLIVEQDGDTTQLFKVPYSVQNDGTVDFDDAQPVTVQYAPVSDSDDTLSASVFEVLTPLERIALAAQPYGEVAYADPGYKNDQKRYPIDTAAHTRAAWSYINVAKNQGGYSGAQVAQIKARIQAACKKFDIEVSDDSKVSASSLVSKVVALSKGS